LAEVVRALRILLHICCGPCACYPVGALRSQGHEVTGFFYNPNIQPFREFERRLEALRSLAESEGVPLVEDLEYDIVAYLKAALADPGFPARCGPCYLKRLDRAAAYARREGYDAFSTTLLVSPYQRHDGVKDAGERASLEHGIPFYYEDFRPGWGQGMKIAREKGLYRQGYCGCVFSEVERYRKTGGPGDAS